MNMTEAPAEALSDSADFIDGSLRQHLAELARRIHTDLVESTTTRGDGEQTVDDDLIERCAREKAPLCSDTEIAALVDMVHEQVFGMGPLDPLLRDPHVSEVMVNGPGPVWLERNGQIERSNVVLKSDEIRLIVDRIVAPLGLRLDRLRPFVDARLADGSRVHITIPPMAIDGPYVTIRRFAKRTLELQAFASDEVAQVLRASICQRHNILVSGGTGAGKTSLLNSLASGIGPTERVVTIEDSAELQLPGEHVVRMEARPATAEGVGELTVRTLVRNALRMRPDRIVVGEVRGSEAFDMVQAMNTGHQGCMATCHANSPVEALDRLAAMVLSGESNVPPAIVDRQVRTAFDVIVHVERVIGPRRRVVEVLEVQPGGHQLIVSDGMPVGHLGSNAERAVSTERVQVSGSLASVP